MYYKNKAKCLVCDDVLHSTQEEADKWVECSCGSLKIKGGDFILVRHGKKYKELSKLELPDDLEINEEPSKQGPPPLPPGFSRK